MSYVSKDCGRAPCTVSSSTPDPGSQQPSSPGERGRSGQYPCRFFEEKEPFGCLCAGESVSLQKFLFILLIVTKLLKLFDITKPPLEKVEAYSYVLQHVMQKNNP